MPANRSTAGSVLALTLSASMLALAAGCGSGKSGGWDAAGLSPEEVEQVAQRQQGGLAPATMGHSFETHRICAGNKVPHGWIKVNAIWDPTACGGEFDVKPNVWVIARYDELPKGFIMDVASDAKTPIGWQTLGMRWDPSTNGSPANPTANVKRIRRAF
ncbi:MAG: hypothetical protein AAGD00_07975 [Planctomycetota bacterium]